MEGPGWKNYFTRTTGPSNPKQLFFPVPLGTFHLKHDTSGFGRLWARVRRDKYLDPGIRFSFRFGYRGLVPLVRLRAEADARGSDNLDDLNFLVRMINGRIGKRQDPNNHV
jgi:hypothetical protein